MPQLHADGCDLDGHGATSFEDHSMRTLESYTLINLRLSYELPARRTLTLSLYGKNLLDEEVLETLTGVKNQIAGRQFYGGLRLRF